ncbi:MAG: electron transfer flavoprotein subunit alpha/FixB family protein [Acidimicrobiia bacterium]|nr:MAG: electron transfer flavoprotein subunit alpha/FixB family protein [Acidimicrobiia bacterium]
MSGAILVVTEHLAGSFTDATFELLALGRELATDTGTELEAAVVGSDVSDMAGSLGAPDRVLVIDDPALESFNPVGHADAVSALVADREPSIVLVPYTSTGMDMASHIAIRSDLPLVSYCQSIDPADGLSATCQLYAGKVEADVTIDGDRAVFAVLAGAASAANGRGDGSPDIEQIANPAGSGGGTVFTELAEPEAGDVDITSEEVLVVVGRGIESEDNIAEAVELAEALGGVVAASRPIVDQGWLPKTRQVGKSGLTVAPKVYLALGVSGAPEHVEGMREASTIIAVNTDPQAPIFGVAHYGWVGDLFDLLPELTDRLE